MLINCKNLILGRVATQAAKRALLAETVNLLNVENLIITGTKRRVIKKYKQKVERGEPYHGPFYPKIPTLFVKRIIRGMLPYKQPKGRAAFKRIKCYKGVPKQFEGKKLETLKNADISRLTNLMYITVGELCRELKQ